MNRQTHGLASMRKPQSAMKDSYSSRADPLALAVTSTEGKYGMNNTFMKKGEFMETNVKIRQCFTILCYKLYYTILYPAMLY